MQVSQEDRERLIALLSEGEEWLMMRILHFAQRHEYAQYTSTLISAWRLSISQLSAAMIDATRTLDEPVLEFRPDDCVGDNPLTAFAVEEAMAHRRRGIRLEMFLGFLKYYRQSYIDLAEERISEPASLRIVQQILLRYFDAYEIALVSKWSATPEDAVIQELSASNRAMTNEKNFYLTAFESFSDPAFLLEADLTVLNLNQAAQSLLAGELVPAGELYYQHRGGAINLGEHYQSDRSQGATMDESLLGASISELLPAVGDALFSQLTEDALGAREVTLEIGGRHYCFALRQGPMQDISGKYRGLVLFLSDISDRKVMEEKLRELSERDPLTGAGNRRYLHRVASREAERARRKGSCLSVLAMDIDHFKRVNDRWGHLAGDKVLVAVAKCCMESMRAYDLLARLGGEEFLVLLPETTVAEAASFADRLRDAISQTHTFFNGEQISVTVSIGVAAADVQESDTGHMFRDADQALYRAKNSGRNCVIMHEQSPVR